MILRKLLAITLLSLASTIMLAFTVLPHHHHQEYICFAGSHCTEEAGKMQHSHDSNPFNDTHNCISELLQAQLHRTQDIGHCCEEGHCHHFIFIPFIVPDLLALIPLKVSIPLKYDITYREKLHDSCVTSHLPQRAPPFIG